MPYHLSFDTGRAVLRADGAVDFESGLAAIAALADDPRLEPGWTILVDLTAAQYTPSLADLGRLNGLDGKGAFLRDHPVAFVAPSPAHFMGASLLAGLATQKGARMKAFRDAGDAAAWLSTLTRND